jgi:DNA-binding NarL/FixJ family response regulator
MASLHTYIVEDNAVILRNLCATLEELTMVKVVGSSADQDHAVGAIRDAGGTLDLLIIDIFLRSGSGLEVLRAVASMRLPARRVVLTNYATDEIRKRCAALGANRVFDKSSELDELIEYCVRLGDGTATSPGSLT